MEPDLLVIGSGPTGQRAAIQAAKLGKRVTVAERRDHTGRPAAGRGTGATDLVHIGQAVMDGDARDGGLQRPDVRRVLKVAALDAANRIRAMT